MLKKPKNLKFNFVAFYLCKIYFSGKIKSYRIITLLISIQSEIYMHFNLENTLPEEKDLWDVWSLGIIWRH